MSTCRIINDNMIPGPLPPELGNCVNLRQLKVDNNFITGAIPASLGLLTNLTDLRMHNNSVHGFLPTSFNNLISLQVLDLGFNHLEGSIPRDLGDLEALIYLDLQGNYLSGSIPSSFAELSSIEIIKLGDNKLSGPVPSLGLGNNLLSLELEDNRFTGPIPMSLRRPGLDLKLYGNPVCLDAMNEATYSCSSNHLLNNDSVSPVCSCPFGMVLRPFDVMGLAPFQCDCVLPLVIELFFPRVLFRRFTGGKQERLARNLARELYLDVWQVVIQSIAQNGTGTDVTFDILPLMGISLDKSTLTRIEKKLYASYLSAVWFDGEFGWFNYVVLQFILPLSQGGSNFAPSQPSLKKKSSEVGVLAIVGSIVGGVGIVLLILTMMVIGWRKYLAGGDIHHVYHSTHNMVSSHNVEGQVFLSGPSSAFPEKQVLAQAKVFTMEELNAAANNFCSDNLIGVGGLGAVYRGVLRDGTHVAIKKLSGLTKEREERFENEIEMSGDRLHGSPHLMQLLGYCRELDERALIYELMLHGSLLDFLEGGLRAAPMLFLDWKTRLQIASGSAKGLRYLHELNPQVIHRDIKPSNILLDENFHAKAKPLLKDKRKRSLVIDPGLRGECPAKAAEVMASLIWSCLEVDPERRPNMVTVESMLNIISDIPMEEM